MSVFEMAKQYYPRLWDKSRLEALVEAGRLTAEEYEEITGCAAEAVGLDGMTVKQLKVYAKERGIALTGITLKEDIIKAIMATL